MKIADIIRMEDVNDSLIILHAEGIFWRAYDRSAFAFSRYVADLKLLKKSFKNLGGREVVYLGFPMSASDSYLKDLELLEQDGKTAKYRSPGNFDEAEYLRWHDDSGPKPDSGEIIRKIRSFDILTSTPLDAFNMLLSLKLILKDTT